MHIGNDLIRLSLQPWPRRIRRPCSSASIRTREEHCSCWTASSTSLMEVRSCPFLLFACAALSCQSQQHQVLSAQRHILAAMKGVTCPAGLDGDCATYYGWVIGINTTTLAVQGSFRTGEGGAADKGGIGHVNLQCSAAAAEAKHPLQARARAKGQPTAAIIQAYGLLVALRLMVLRCTLCRATRTAPPTGRAGMACSNSSPARFSRMRASITLRRRNGLCTTRTTSTSAVPSPWLWTCPVRQLRLPSTHPLLPWDVDVHCSSLYALH